MRPFESVLATRLPHPVKVLIAGLLATLIVLTTGQLLDQIAPEDAQHSTDSQHYLKLARGDVANVAQPFSGRTLLPVLARGAADRLGISLQSAFYACSLLSLMVLAMLAAQTYYRGRLSHAMLVLAVIFCNPLLARLLGNYYLPDLLHAGLVMLAFACLQLADRRSSAWLLAAAAVYLAFVTRESTLLFCGVALGVLLARRRFAPAAMILLASLLGAYTAARFAALGKPNIHDLGALGYSVLKVGYNAFNNLLGVHLWSDTLAAHHGSGYCLPIRQWQLPRWEVFGGMRSVGVCGADFGRPVGTAVVWLTSFGVLPTLLVAAAARIYRQGRALPDWLLMALIYGALAFLIAPLIGVNLSRLIAYAWPLCWLAAPLLVLPAAGEQPGQALGKILLVQLLVCFLPVLAGLAINASDQANLAVLLLATPLHILVLRWARKAPETHAIG